MSARRFARTHRTPAGAGRFAGPVPLAAGLTAVAVVLSGCAADAAAGGPAGEPVPGGTLEFAVQDAPRNLDLHHGASSFSEGIIQVNVGDKLIYQDAETGELHPWLATSWEPNDDATEFRIELRDDVTFSDGEPLTAEVVKKNFDLLAHGDDERGIQPVTAFWRDYAGTEVTGGHSLTVSFETPSAGFPQALSHYYSGLLGSASLELPFEERVKPENIISTGPFTVTEHVEQERTVLTKRDDYDWAPEGLDHDGAAYLDEVVINVAPEPSVRTGALLSDSLDAILDVNLTDEQVIADAGYQVISQVIPGRDIAFDFNLATEPVNDRAVREAITWGWDRGALQETVLTDSYATSTSAVSTPVPGYVDHSEYLRFDQPAAEAVLDEAGWVPGSDGIREKDGQRLEVSLLAIDNLVPNRPGFELIQQNLAQIGIDLSLEILPIPEYSAKRNEREHNIIVYNQSRNDISVIEQSYSPEWNNSAGLVEGDEYHDRAIEVLSALSATTDPGQRARNAVAAQDFVLNEAVLTVPVYSPAQVAGASPDVHGLRLDAHSRALFYDTWKSGQ